MDNPEVTLGKPEFLVHGEANRYCIGNHVCVDCIVPGGNGAISRDRNRFSEVTSC